MPSDQFTRWEYTMTKTGHLYHWSAGPVQSHLTWGGSTLTRCGAMKQMKRAQKKFRNSFNNNANKVWSGDL